MQVWARKGAKEVPLISSGDRTRRSMAVFANAAGGTMTPAVLLNKGDLARKFQEIWPESLMVATDCATQTKDSFRLCMQHLKQTQPSGH